MNSFETIHACGVIGQDAVWAEWMTALQSHRLHHAWLLTGARGLGKRAFAHAAASQLVHEVDQPDIAHDQHPDIVTLTHLPATEDDAKKKADGKPYQTKRNISVDQIRGMIRRLSTKPTLGSRRAIIVDPADDLEKGAVNALLKVLEEPPEGTYFLLIAHQPGKLLPTVRSRCRILRFTPIDAQQLDTMLIREVPEADASARKAAIAAAQGSPGLALSVVQQDLGAIHKVMTQILAHGDPTMAARGVLAQEMGARPARERQLAALELARAVLAGELAHAPRDRQLRIIEAHSTLTRLSAEAPTFNFDAGLLIMEIGGLLASAAMPRDAVR